MTNKSGNSEIGGLIRRARKGDDQAKSQLVARYRAYLLLLTQAQLGTSCNVVLMHRILSRKPLPKRGATWKTLTLSYRTPGGNGFMDWELIDDANATVRWRSENSTNWEGEYSISRLGN